MLKHLCAQYKFTTKSSRCHLMGCRDAYSYGVSICNIVVGLHVKTCALVLGTAVLFVVVTLFVCNALASHCYIVNVLALCSPHGLMTDSGNMLRMDANMQITIFTFITSLDSLPHRMTVSTPPVADMIYLNDFTRVAMSYMVGLTIQVLSIYDSDVHAKCDDDVIITSTGVFCLKTLRLATQHAISATFRSKFIEVQLSSPWPFETCGIAIVECLGDMLEYHETTWLAPGWACTNQLSILDAGTLQRGLSERCAKHQQNLLTKCNRFVAGSFPALGNSYWYSVACFGIARRE